MKPLLRLIEIDTPRVEMRLPGSPDRAPAATETPEARLCMGALNLLLRHGLTGCNRSAEQALALLERIADAPGIDEDMRRLCAEASQRLAGQPIGVFR